jgi:clan AA aspartic protease
MIVGAVCNCEARIRLQVQNASGQLEEIEAVIDTGFTSYLTLPPALISSLGLRWMSTARGILGDGSERLFDVFEAVVFWDTSERTVFVDEADVDPLVGMSLLDGYELKIQIRAGGKVTIKPLARRT